MRITCPACRTGYRIDPAKTAASLARVTCPKCRHRFEVSLAPAAASPSPAAGTSSRVTVLVVDDSRFFRELILDVLKEEPYRLLTAGDGREALTLIRQEKPGLVILDLNLPVMNGYDLIRAVRQEADLAKTKLLAVSGVFRRDSDVSAVEEAGADDFLGKSFKPEHLILRVKKLLEGGS